MQAAAGSNVVTAVSQRNPVTGAVSLTPQTIVDGTMRPAAEVLPFVVCDAAVERHRVAADSAGVRAGGVRDHGLRADLRPTRGGVSRRRFDTRAVAAYHIGTASFGGCCRSSAWRSSPDRESSTPASTTRLSWRALTFLIGSLLLTETHSV
jgi:hypothetical protein